MDDFSLLGAPKSSVRESYSAANILSLASYAPFFGDDLSLASVMGKFVNDYLNSVYRYSSILGELKSPVETAKGLSSMLKKSYGVTNKELNPLLKFESIRAVSDITGLETSLVDSFGNNKLPPIEYVQSVAFYYSQKLGFGNLDSRVIARETLLQFDSRDPDCQFTGFDLYADYMNLYELLKKVKDVDSALFWSVKNHPLIGSDPNFDSVFSSHSPVKPSKSSRFSGLMRLLTGRWDN